MLAASVYIAVCSARNRIRVRLRRLREPRYLIGAVVGAAYLYFSIFARTRGARAGRPGRNAPAPFDLTAAARVMGSTMGGLGLFVLAVIAWILPASAAVFEYSEAERAMLFPAPLSRRELLVHRLVRSQASSLLASVVIAVFAAPSSGTWRLRVGLATWALLVTFRVYSAAVALTRARCRSADASIRRGGWLTVAVVAAAVLIVAGRIAPALQPAPVSLSDALVRVARVIDNRATRVVLWPFMAVLKPLFVASWTEFAGAFVACLAVLGVTAVWMLSNDVVFDDVVGDQPLSHAEVRRTDVVPTADRRGWPLATTGRLEFALFWKGAMHTIRTNHFRWRYVPPLVAILFASGGAAAAVMRAGNMRGPASLVTGLSGMVTALAVFLGPQLMRADLRSDFDHLDVIKTWPARASDVIRGEMAWPVVVVCSVAWCAALIGGIFSGASLPRIAFVDRWSVVVAVLLVAPALVAAQYTVHNAATIVFPAWVQLGSQRARGIDALGQRLILLAAVVASLLLFALPGAIGAVVIWIVLHRLAGALVFVPMAIAFAVIVLIEVLAITELLGPAYERLDVTSIERAE